MVQQFLKKLKRELAYGLAIPLLIIFWKELEAGISKGVLSFFFFFCGTGAWTQGIHLEPLHQSFLLW
jgi:hypothetical protein